MAPRGAKPKPTHLKLVTGNPGRRPLNLQEPKPKLSIPPMPSHLGEIAQGEWKRLAEELFKEGVLTGWDSGVLEAYCYHYGGYVKARNEMEGEEMIVLSATGTPKANPLIGIANSHLNHLRLFASELGLSPASRSRVTRAKKQEDQDEFFG